MKQLRAELSSAEQNDLPDSAFAYIESGGTKDEDGKTTPRKLRHYPVQDKAHADNTLARANAAIEGDDEDAKAIAKAALPKIKAAVAKFDEAEQKKASEWNAQHRDSTLSYEDLRDMLTSAASAEFGGTDDDGYEEWVYVYDFGDDWLVYSKKGEKFRCSYELDGNEVTLGDPEPVRATTTYQPMEAKSAPRNPATPKRAFSSLVEQAPAHTIQAQVRMDEGEDANIANFVGYASTTGDAYSVRDWLGEYTETIMPGAFAKTLREREDIPLLFNHDGVPLASTSSGTSRLSEDGEGLRNEADLDRRDALTNSVCVQLQRGVLSKMSFSFRAVKDTWNDAYDDRGVTEAALYDTSIVTYPANPATSGELTEAMRSALGREGRSLWLAEHELSVRSALPVFVEKRELPEDAGDLLERALRALAHADEVVCRSRGPHGRGRTFRVAQAMLELRAGKVLSSANEELLQTALTALTSADASHSTAADAVSTVLGGAGDDDDDAEEASADGKNGNKGAGNGNPINSQDGAGPRSASLTLKRKREAELRALRR
jgi:HK97 family phage prohead protease